MGPNKRAIEREEAAARRAEAERRRRTTPQMQEDAERAIADWNCRLQRGEPVWTVPIIGAALAARYPWLAVYCPGCKTVVDVDLSKVDRHPDAPVTTLLIGWSCELCRGGAGPMPRLLGLAQIKPDPTRKAEDVA
jgi:hypothetical protein